MTNFATWLDTFVSEKGLDTDFVFEVEGAGGTNFIPLECVIDFIKGTDADIKAKIKTTLVKIDFMNGDAMHFFNHCAKGMAQ